MGPARYSGASFKLSRASFVAFNERPTRLHWGQIVKCSRTNRPGQRGTRCPSKYAENQCLTPLHPTFQHLSQPVPPSVEQHP
jgi:hypothetical protein